MEEVIIINHKYIINRIELPLKQYTLMAGIYSILLNILY